MELVYWILFVCYASYAYNRKIVVLSMPTLKQDGLDASDAGLIISCQNIAFAVSKFLAGVLSDRVNPQLLFATGLVASGSAAIFFSSASSVTTFCCLWFLNGLAQGCGWPSCAKILRQRASPSQFGTLWSILSSSNNFSGSLGPFLSSFMLVHYGWRWNVFIAGFLSLFLCAFFILTLPFLFASTPAKSQDRQKSSVNKSEQTKLSDLLLDPFMWLLSAGFFVVFCARSTTTDWGQMYLMEEKRHNQYVASAFISSVETGGFIGRIAAGYLTDRVIAKSVTRDKKNSVPTSVLRMKVALVFVLGSVLSLHLFQFAVSEASTLIWILLVGALMGMSYYGPIAIFGIVASESAPSHLSGASHATVSLFGNIGATISGLPFSYIAKFYHWSTVFLLLEIMAAGMLLIMVLCRKLTPKFGKSKEE